MPLESTLRLLIHSYRPAATRISLLKAKITIKEASHCMQKSIQCRGYSYNGGNVEDIPITAGIPYPACYRAFITLITFWKGPFCNRRK